MAEHYPTQSVAQLADQGKVTGWSQPESNATGADGADVGTEILALSDAQVVSNNAPEFAESQETPVELQKGPRKKYLDAGNGANGANGASNTTDNTNNNSDNSNANTGNSNGVSFAAQPEMTDNTNNNNNENDNNNKGGGGYDDFFSGMDANGDDVDDSNNKTHPNNATVISLPTVGDNDEQFDDYGDAKQDDAVDAAPTALSLWEAERRKVLQERIDNEKSKQRETVDEADKDLKDFIDNRQERIVKARKDAKSREDGIRDEYNSVYKNGTIWEQVAKLVDLSTQDESVVRMRDLLIELKNQGKVQKK